MALARFTGFEADYLHVDTVPSMDDRQIRIILRGEADANTAPMVHAAVIRALVPPLPDVLELDLDALSFIDAAAVRCLLRCRAAADEAGVRMLLRDPAPEIMHVLDILDLTGRFGIIVDAADDSASVPGSIPRLRTSPA
jgi:anti-anti-sigma factor